MKAADRLMQEYTAEHMGKVFYFCLRRTGNKYAAEDLTEEISAEILTQLRRGSEPASFDSWVWQIARNRYARWAASKRRKADAESAAPIEDHGIPADNTPEDELIQREDISLLRRELAFICADHRDIIVEYYLKDRSIKDIAASLSISEASVKTRLFRARNKIREGMKMAREFGKLSYAPENVGFIKSGCDGDYGQPHSITEHKLYQNILLAAYKNPSTAEELAIELGVALPYMADELDYLTQQTLLKKNKDRYETSFCIVSREAQEEIYSELRRVAPALTKATIAALEHWAACLSNNGIEWHGGFRKYEDMKWALLMIQADKYRPYGETNGDSPSNTPRPNGGFWDISGIESVDGYEPTFVGLHGSGDMQASFGQFKFYHQNIQTQTPTFLEAEEWDALYKVAQGRAAEADKEMLANLERYGYIKHSDGAYAPAVALLYYNRWHLTEAQQKEQAKLDTEACRLNSQLYEYIKGVVHREIPRFLENDEYQISHACGILMQTRGAIFEEALRTGYLTYGGGKTEAKDRCLGAYIYM